MMASAGLFFIVMVAISHLPNVEAQPGNRVEEDAKVTGNGTLAAGEPLLQLANNTDGAEVGSPKATLKSSIHSLVDLRQAYLDLKTAPWSRPQDSTIFTFYPTDAVKYTSLAIFYDLSSKENQPADLVNSSDCCNSQNTSNCQVFFRYHSHLYRAIYPPHIYLYAFPTSPFDVWNFSKSIKRKMDKFGMHKLCWKVPPFNRQCDPVALKEFTAEFPHLVLSANEGPIQVGPVDHYTPGNWEKGKMDAITDDRKLAINFVVLCVFIAIIPLFLLAMDTYSTTVSTVLMKSKFAAKCSYVVMFQSWFWALYLIFNTIQILRAMVHTAQNSKKYLYELLMPDVVMCFIVFGVQMGVILIELPFLCCYFWRSPVVRDVYMGRSRLPHLVKLKKGAASMGWMGIVVFCQFGSTMMCYVVMFLFIDPLYAVTRMGVTALVLLSTTVASLYIGLSCANFCSCASCTCQKCHKYFLMIMVLLVVGFADIFAYRVLLHDPFTDRTESRVTGLLSSVLSSAILALFGYICKKLVWNRITQEVQEFDQVTQNNSNADELCSSAGNDMSMLCVSGDLKKDTN